jgi:hypothetical protein
MRSPRTATVVGVIGLVLLCAGWWLAGVGTAGPTRQATRAAAVWPVIPPVPQPLLRQLQQYLFRSAHPLPPNRFPIPRRLAPGPRRAPTVNGSTCFVAGGFCSITPCVVPVVGGPGPGCRAPAPPAPALAVSRLATPASAPTFRPPSP